MFGHKGVNRSYFADRYPRLNIRYVKDADTGFSLVDNQYKVLDQGPAINIKEVNDESSNHSCR